MNMKKADNHERDSEYPELERLETADNAEMSRCSGGGQNVTEGLSHLMKQASSQAINQQMDFLNQSVETTFGTGEFHGQSVQSLAETGLSALETELDNKGEVLSKAGVEAYICPLVA